MIILSTVLTLGYFSVFADACSGDGVGIELLGETYGCEYLQGYLTEDKNIGIYKNRKHYCNLPSTDCCETCSKILRCKDAPVDGIYLAETHFNCSYLLKYYPEDQMVGIYKDRKSICKKATTDCCESCEKVLAEKDATTPTVSAPTTTTTKPRSEPTSIGTPTTAEYQDTCVTDCLWIGDGSTGECSWLRDPSRPEFNRRHRLCRNGMAPGCKRTCHMILTETGTTQVDDKFTTQTALPDACSGDGVGIELLGETYGCEYLQGYLTEDKHIGIYKNRKHYCNLPSTDCCETCSKILRCKDAPVDGIYLAETHFNCSYLLKYYPEDQMVGIYKDRKSICKKATTDCCESCEKVLAEKDATTPTVSAPTTTTTKPRSEPTSIGTPTTAEYQDTCVTDCLWIGDGSTGECSWLRDPSRPEFNRRHRLCRNGMAPGCKRTCHMILTETGTTQVDDKFTTQTARPVCVDTYIMVAKHSYDCGDLQNPASSIYSKRYALCASDNGACCITCGQVKEEKSSGVIKYNEQNMIDKKDDVIVVSKATDSPDSLKSASYTETKLGTAAQAQIPNQNGLLAFFEAMKTNVEKMQKEEEIRRKAFSLMISNIISLFKKMNPTEK